MRKLILIVHVSLDGFVGGPQGELDGFDPGEDNLQFVCDIARDADAALFGTTSYHLLNNYWPNAYQRPNATKGEVAYSHWYNNAEKIIVSKTEKPGEKKTVIKENVLVEMSRIKSLPGKSILIFGSPHTTQGLMRLGLIDEYWVFVNPVIFGQGIPLFVPLPKKIKLKLLDTHGFSNGEFALHYSVA